MSAVWLKFAAILCLSRTALSATESSGVLWRDFGGDVTFKCKCPEPGQEYLEVRKGLSEEISLLYKESDTGKTTISQNFTGRLQVHGGFPEIQILIKNLTLEDTGPYWCFYKKFDQMSHRNVITKVAGALVVVVKGTETQQECKPSHPNRVLVSVVTPAAVICIMLGVLICVILKKKTLKSRCIPPNADHKGFVEHDDVYL